MDFSEASEALVSSVEVQTIADENRITATLTPHLVAAVIAPSDHMFGLSRMWETFAEATGWTIQIFRDRAEALAWLREQVPNAAA